jgi:hypothetical protein
MSDKVARELALAARLEGPGPRETILNPTHIQGHRQLPRGNMSADLQGNKGSLSVDFDRPVSFSEGLRAAAQRLYAPKPEGKIKSEHTVDDMPDYKEVPSLFRR